MYSYKMYHLIVSIISHFQKVVLKFVSVSQEKVFENFEQRDVNLSFDDLPTLQSSRIRMKNEKVVLQKISKIVCGGAKKLRIVSDYDSTLTKQHEGGTLVNSSFGVFFRGSTQLPESYKARDKMLVTKYGKIESDPSVPLDVKLKAMKEWDRLKVQSVKGINFNPEEIQDLAQKYKLPLREGTLSLFDRLEQLGVPVLVLSAGLGDMVEALMRSQQILLKNVRIVSNFFKFGGMTLKGFKNNNLINSYNKSEGAVGKDLAHWVSQPNVIVMGDNLGDAFMADDSLSAQNILKIGFFYHEKTELLPLYEEAFDLVLIDDQTMDVVTEIVNLIR